MLNGIKTNESIQLCAQSWEAICEQLFRKYFEYGRQPLYPVLEMMGINIQIIWEVCRLYPNIGMNLLQQVVDFDSKQAYEQEVLSEIEALAQEDNTVAPLVDSLKFLRRCLGDEPEFLTSAFHREIAMLPGVNKSERFKAIVREACRDAINDTSKEIQRSFNNNRTVTLR